MCIFQFTQYHLCQVSENDLIIARGHFHDGFSGEFFLAAGFQQEIG